MTTPQAQELINAENSITRKEITDSVQRSMILPKYFPGAELKAELLVYHWMDRLCDGYSGGYWLFYELSNGGFYMAPQNKTEFETQCPGFGDSVRLSADAAGLVACLFAVNQIANETATDDIINLYYRIRDYAAGHAEAAGIFRAID